MKKLIVSIALSLLMVCLLVIPVGAANPTVTITFSAAVVAGTVSDSTWAAGVLEVDDVVYFSADNTQDDDYCTFTNTGNVACDVELQGTNAEGGDYDLTLASSAASEQFSLYANSSNGSSTYDIEVKTSSYNDLVTDVGANTTYSFSLNMTMPTAFNANDDGSTKTSTLTLALTRHT